MKILNKLTIKHLTLNKKRTVASILGIMLSTALMVGIGLILSIVRDSTMRSTIKNEGRYMVKYLNVDRDKIDLLNNKEIKDYYYYSTLGYSKLEKVVNKDKPYIEVVEVDNNFFNELELVGGVLPTKENEIVVSESLINNGEYEVKIGDTIDLKVGTFESSEEELNEVTSYSFKVVGIVKKYVTENYRSIGYQIYIPIKTNNEINIFVNFKNPKKTYDLGVKYTNLLDVNGMEEVIYNDTLLIWYGASRFENVLTVITGLLLIALSLISIGCIIVIYNSFAISVMERKKQFGLYASIGATKKQLKHTVFFEALIVGLIGIFLGILSAYLGIGVVLLILSNILKNMMNVQMHLCTYPIFIIIPIIFMIITVFISAFLPAKRASKSSPISVIKGNDDIKIKGKKVKTNKLVRKIFGIEGEVALKNVKRNKKKYRITIASLFISIVLFISFSSFLKYGMDSIHEYSVIPEYNIEVYNYEDKDGKNYEPLYKIKDHYQVDNYVIKSPRLNFLAKLENASYDKKYLSLDFNYGFYPQAEIYMIDDDNYKKLVQKYHVDDHTNFLINHFSDIDYSHGNRIVKEGKIFKNTFDSLMLDDGFEINNIHFIDEVPFGFSLDMTLYPVLIVNKEIYNKLELNYYDRDVYGRNIMNIQAKKYDELMKFLDHMEENSMAYYINIEEEFRNVNNMLLTVKILFYGFIALVTLIGVTSVFNTINTSINLRRKEFAVLRSIGLSPRGFNRMLYFESIFFGIKSLLYALPVSIGISYLIFDKLTDLVSASYKLPIESILISIISVFIIVFITMMYSSSKIKHENILESIREENI